jgi:arginyl-tRNA synthetase
MNQIRSTVEAAATKVLHQLYNLSDVAVELQQTRKEFEGDLTLVVFPYLRASRKGPEQTAQEIGEQLLQEVAELSNFNVVKGFLNLSISDAVWANTLKEISTTNQYGRKPQGEETIMVEYSSPNTNKPLHLGHIRNNLLGYSVAELLKANGKKVIKAQIINDRGIHICKSMLAWQKFGNGETPASTGLKGDKLVGKYYVEFDRRYKAQVTELIAGGKEAKEAEHEAPLLIEARGMLQKWEQGDPETVALWETMNGWVYEGFESTYERLGVDFDKYYYESQTYLLGKQVVEEGLAKGVFYQKEDGSVWIDLTGEGLDHKLLLRSDGTSVYMTQDIGTAIQRFVDFKEQNLSGMIYTVGNEQDYHFKVLFIILEKLGYAWAKNLYHLSYGMVDLPSGKMKSREGTVVDADDLIEEMNATAKKISEELGKTEGLSEEEKAHLYHMVGMGALKYYILKVDPRKRMLFNPEESVDFQGNTGPFIQYTHARIKSLLRKGVEQGKHNDALADAYVSLQLSEQALVKQLALFPETVEAAANEFSPAVVGMYVYDLVKLYNSLYQQLPILADESDSAVAFRLRLSKATADVVKTGMGLLGIEVPERM